MRNVLLSIIIPVYNVEEYVEQCIDSIIKQINIKKNLTEIILVDDGSTDKSGKICDDYSKLYNFIKVYHKQNEGLSATRNYGLKKANGNYVWFIDSDDYINDDILNKILSKLKEEDVDILLANSYVVDVKGNITRTIEHKGLNNNSIYNGLEVIKKQIEKTNDYNTTVWIRIYKKNFLLQNNLFFKEGLIHEDELWTPMTLVHAKKVIYIDEVIYNYRIRPNSIMTSKKTDNSNHIKSIIYNFNNLPHYMDKYVKDKYILSLIKDNICKKYLHDITYWNFYKYPELYNEVDRKQIFKNSLKLKNKVRSTILLINKNLYCKLISILNVGDKNEK